MQQAVLPGHLGRDVGQVKINMEGGQVPHQAAVGAVPVSREPDKYEMLRISSINLKYRMASIESSRSDPGAYTATESGPLHLQEEQFVAAGHHEHHLLDHLSSKGSRLSRNVKSPWVV